MKTSLLVKTNWSVSLYLQMNLSRNVLLSWKNDFLNFPQAVLNKAQLQKTQYTAREDESIDV